MEYAEFEDMMASQIGEPITTNDMKYYFKKFDRNGDGFITSDELALVMKTFGGKSYSKEEIDDMIKEADVDADGKVSYTGTTVTLMRLSRASMIILTCRVFLLIHGQSLYSLQPCIPKKPRR